MLKMIFSRVVNVGGMTESLSRRGVLIPMREYKSVRSAAAIVICAILLNTHTETDGFRADDYLRATMQLSL